MPVISDRLSGICRCDARLLPCEHFAGQGRSAGIRRGLPVEEHREADLGM